MSRNAVFARAVARGHFDNEGGGDGGMGGGKLALEIDGKVIKDRKDRVLSPADVTHYLRVVVALHESIRIMGEIDETIAIHGGWPNAFLASETIAV